MDETAGQQPTEQEGVEPQTAERAKDERFGQYLQRIALGDPQALADLYDESSGLAFGIAIRILRDSADAEEVTLDVYTYVWRSAAQFDMSRASAATWLVMLTRSRALTRLRSITSRKKHNSNFVDNLMSTPVALSSERLAVVSALQQLESADRELLELAFYSGLSHSELATKLMIPLGTAKSRVRAALARLRKLMREG
jgi:RNA polymerase sigma-70 factor (ECF subfamily)